MSHQLGYDSEHSSKFRYIQRHYFHEDAFPRRNYCPVTCPVTFLVFLVVLPLCLTATFDMTILIACPLLDSLHLKLFPYLFIG